MQSLRLDLYNKYIAELLDKGHAYKCFCTEKRLEILKKEAARSRSPNIYDRRCMHLSQGEIDEKVGRGLHYTVRFKLSPIPEPYIDLVYGPVAHNVFEFEGDPIILKSDGFPTYHLANVVDDHLMNISHVLRGVEWQISTPKHILMYRALGWDPPQFGHLPLILNSDGTKLSKRQNDLHVRSLRESLFSPESILNFVSLVGGGFKDKEYSLYKLYTLQQLVDRFDFSKIHIHPAKLEMDRLGELNQAFIKDKWAENKTEMIEHCRSLVRQTYDDVDPELITFSVIERYLDWALDRIKNISDLTGPDFKFLWMSPDKYDIISTNEEDLQEIIKLYKSSSEFKSFSKEVKHFCKSSGNKFPRVMKDLRILLTGMAEGPSVKEIIDILGEKEAINRFNSWK